MSEPITMSEAEALEPITGGDDGTPMRGVFRNLWFDPLDGPPEGEEWVWVSNAAMGLTAADNTYIRRLSLAPCEESLGFVSALLDRQVSEHPHQRPEIHNVNQEDKAFSRNPLLVSLRSAIEAQWQVNRTWTFRVNRQPLGPLTRGKFCDWCKCGNCQGEEHPGHGFSHIELEDGTHMCDTCYLYPPCGNGDDCTEFNRTGHCSHRPNLAEGARWVEWKVGEPAP